MDSLKKKLKKKKKKARNWIYNNSFDHMSSSGTMAMHKTKSRIRLI